MGGLGESGRVIGAVAIIGVTGVESGKIGGRWDEEKDDRGGESSRSGAGVKNPRSAAETCWREESEKEESAEVEPERGSLEISSWSRLIFWG